MKNIWLLLLMGGFVHAEFSALLLRIEHNDLFHFSYKEHAFSCEPATLTTLTRLFNKKDLESSCKETIEAFVEKYPFVPYQAELILHEEQKYLIKPLKKRCFIMLNGGISYTEYMIEHGYGLLPKQIDPDFQDSAEHQKLLLAQKRAQYHKRGVWENSILLNCFNGE